MGRLSDAEFLERKVQSLGVTGLRAEASRNAVLGLEPDPGLGYMEQLGAAFQQENLATNAARVWGNRSRIFAPEEGFDPRAHLGEYSQFVDQFPRLLRARSFSELAFVKNQVDREREVRQSLEGMGFMRALSVFLPAGLLSPENFIPIGGALRAAGLGVRATRAARGARFVERALSNTGALQAFRTGTEAAVAQSVAELALSRMQGFRTEEEAALNIVGAGLFGSVLGAAGAQVGRSRASAMKAVLGAESVEEALEGADVAVGRALSGDELGPRLDRLFGKVKEGADLGLEDATEARGILLEALRKHNPKLARLLALETGVGRWVAKMLVFTPAARLARSDLEESRLLGDLITKHFLRTDTIDRPSIESVLELAEIGMFRLRDEQRRIWQEAEPRLRGTISEQQAFSLAGRANRRGDTVNKGETFLNSKLEDEDVYPAEILASPEAVSVVEKIARANRDFMDTFRSTADRVGAMSESELERAATQRLFELIDDSFLPRFIVQETASVRAREFKEAIRQGLLHQKQKLEPRFREEIDSLEGRLDRLREERAELAKDAEPGDLDELDWDIQKTQRDIKERADIIDELTREDGFRNLVESIAENYTRGLGDRRPASQSMLRSRALMIEDRFLEGFMVDDIRVLQARMIRSVLPDLLLADQFDRLLARKPLLANTGAESQRIYTKVERMLGDETATEEQIAKVIDDLENLLEDTQEMALLANMRLLRDLKEATGSSDLVSASTRVSSLFDVRRAEKRKLKRAERDLDVATADAEGLRPAVRDILRRQKMSDDVEGLRALRKRFNEEPNEFRQNEREFLEEFFSARDRQTRARKSIRISQKTIRSHTQPLQAIALAIGDQVGKSERSIGLSTSRLSVARNRVSLGRASRPDQRLEQLAHTTRAITSRVAEDRRSVWRLNVDAEQLLAYQERGARRELAKMPESQRLAFRKKVDKEMAALETELLRLRNRHGIDNVTFGRGGKRLRDLNYLRAMGSITLSSLPDLAMAISTAGFRNYARAVSSFLTDDLRLQKELKTRQGRSAAAEMIHAAELGMAIERHKKLYGLEDDIVPGFDSRIDNFLDDATSLFTRATMLDRWNALNKFIAHTSIQSRVMKTSLGIWKGSRVSAADRQMLKLFGISDEDARLYARLFLEFGETDNTGRTPFFHPHSRDWTGENKLGLSEAQLRTARIKFEAQILKGVNDTIITPSVGTLPPFATEHALGRMLFQFRTFSFAVTQQFLIPGIQRVLSNGLADPAPIVTMAMLSTLGMTVYAVNELLKGRDPFADREDESWQTRMIIEGVDRGGGFGILTEALSSFSKVIGLGIGPQSRFASRNVFDALLGPSAGVARDLLKLVGAPARGEFTEGDASRLRRLIPFQNLIWTRIFLDLGPNLPNAGTEDFFSQFLKIEQRALGFGREGS